MTEPIEIEDLSTVCRVCLEKASRMYPLVGPILNVDVDILTMIMYCTSVEIELAEELPKWVCIPCFRTIRIAYNFISEFKETNQKLLELRESLKVKQEDNFDVDSSIIITSKEDILNLDDYSLVEANDEEDEEDMNYKEEVLEELGQCEEEGTVITYDENQESDCTDSREEPQIMEVEKLEEETSEAVEPEVAYQPRKKATIKFYTCPICAKKVTRFTTVFLPHLYTHKDEIFTCDLCATKPRMEVYSYIQHYKKTHLYQCDICNKSLSQKSSQYYHMKLHSENKTYTCTHENCNKTFMTMMSLKKHMNIHSESINYVCSKCGKKFNTYDTFRYHQKTHDGKRNYLCTECGRSFLQSVHLKYHMWKHTGIKRFRCDKCEKSYTSVTQLKKHLRKYCGAEEADSVKTRTESD